MGGVQSTAPGVPPAQQLGNKSGREADVDRPLVYRRAGASRGARLVAAVDVADSSAAALGRLVTWEDASGLMLRSLTAGAERWRGIIDGADVDAPERREARYAHAAIAATLFALRGAIATSGLSALVDVFNEQERARESGKEALTLSFCDPRYPYGPVNSVESLIGYAAQRMSGADRPQ